MYAIVDIGGQQFRVEKSDNISTSRLDGEVGSKVEFDHVLLTSTRVGTKVGTPYVDGAKVQATIIAHDKNEKVIVFKKKRRKGFKALRGHRQPQTKLRIDKIIS